MKLILFDLDGTVLDTVPDIMACCNDTLHAFSLPPITEEETKRFVGNGAKKLVERFLKGRLDLLEEAYSLYKEKFPLYVTRTRYYPQEREVLESLKRKNKLAIVTNKPQSAADEVVKRYLPDVPVFGQRDGFAVKPDPALTEFAIRSLGFETKDCIFVGDGETDIEVARNVGIPCISVLWGNRTREELFRAGGTIFVENFEELERAIALM
ncbi:MAG: HAD family hydrolase [Clostridia bacterium]|nr:HAD family hydrolase [Clostridia bacterium]